MPLNRQEVLQGEADRQVDVWLSTVRTLGKVIESNKMNFDSNEIPDMVDYIGARLKTEMMALGGRGRLFVVKAIFEKACQ